MGLPPESPAQIANKQLIRKKYAELVKKLAYPFLHFTHDFDLNINRFPNSLLDFAQEHKEIFNTAGQSVFPNDSVRIPGRAFPSPSPLIEYHPVQLNYKHRLDFLFNI
jgi:hypothetical protein